MYSFVDTEGIRIRGIFRVIECCPPVFRMRRVAPKGRMFCRKVSRSYEKITFEILKLNWVLIMNFLCIPLFKSFMLFSIKVAALSNKLFTLQMFCMSFQNINVREGKLLRRWLIYLFPIITFCKNILVTLFFFYCHGWFFSLLTRVITTSLSAAWTFGYTRMILSFVFYLTLHRFSLLVNPAHAFILINWVLFLIWGILRVIQ